MKRLMILGLLIALTLPLSAIEDGQVTYAGGTIAGLAPGSTGRFDTKSDTVLTFEYGSNKLAIPFTAIQSFHFSTEVTHHLGVLPAIAVGLLKARQRRHYLSISYRVADGAPQVGVFEVPKRMPPALQAILQARTRQVCKPYSPCEGRN